MPRRCPPTAECPSRGIGHPPPVNASPPTLERPSFPATERPTSSFSQLGTSAARHRSPVTWSPIWGVGQRSSFGARGAPPRRVPGRPPVTPARAAPWEGQSLPAAVVRCTTTAANSAKVATAPNAGSERGQGRPKSDDSCHSVRHDARELPGNGDRSERRIWSGPDPDDERSVRRRLNVRCVRSSRGPVLANREIAPALERLRGSDSRPPHVIRYPACRSRRAAATSRAQRRVWGQLGCREWVPRHCHSVSPASPYRRVL